ncbi:MAG: class I SAM-dependent methyltransferase [Acidobacteria bacterium]|nr:class I SAM-dependent methyltransferase [Acidobacteriota bacterium]MDW7983168.1 class I SAM-dependent methyltransferase [Acidobacteriota bacterium]
MKNELDRDRVSGKGETCRELLGADETRPCPACGTVGGLVPFREGDLQWVDLRPDDFRITDAQYGRCWSLHRCRRCGMVTAHPMPPAELLSRFYEAVEDPTYMAEAAFRRRNFERILKFLMGRLGLRPGRLLDVGAALGVLVEAARQAGWEAYGIEPSRAMAEAARRRGVPVETARLETWAGPAHAFDVITLLDVIEHVSEPDHFLAKALQHLRPGGVVCIVTPDVASVAARLLGRRWWHYRPGHVHFFSNRSLSVLIERFGGQIVARRRYCWFFSLDFLLSRLHGGQPVSWLPEGCRRWVFPVNLRDSLEVYARWSHPESITGAGGAFT